MWGQYQLLWAEKLKTTLHLSEYSQAEATQASHEILWLQFKSICETTNMKHYFIF